MEPTNSRVLVEVEPEYVNEVLAFIARLREVSEPDPRGDAARDVPANESGWNRHDIVHIASRFPYAALGTLLDELAANENQWLVKRDVETRCGLAPNDLRAQFTGFTKRYLSENRTQWFWEYRKFNGLFEYRMTPTIAQWWREGRAAASGQTD